MQENILMSNGIKFHICYYLRTSSTNFSQSIITSFLTWRRSYSFAEYWKHFMARLNGVHAFGYNSTGSERIWMKFGALSTLFAAGRGTFSARSAQNRERDSEAIFL